MHPCVGHAPLCWPCGLRCPPVAVLHDNDREDHARLGMQELEQAQHLDVHLRLRLDMAGRHGDQICAKGVARPLCLAVTVGRRLHNSDMIAGPSQPMIHAEDAIRAL